MAKLNVQVIFLLAVVAVVLGAVPCAEALSLRLGFSPNKVTIFCPTTASAGQGIPMAPIVPPPGYPLMPAALVDYHVVPGIYDKKTLQSLPNNTMIPTMVPGLGLLVTNQRVTGRVWINGVRIRGWSVYKDGSNSVVHMTDQLFDPRRAHNPVPIPRGLFRKYLFDWKSPIAYNIACHLSNLYYNKET